jgi:hypothetical protein
MKMKWKFESSRQEHEPETLIEFLKVTAIQATKDFFEPLCWLKALLSYVKLHIRRVWSERLSKH